MDERFDLIRCLTTHKREHVLIWLLNIGAEKYWHPVHAGVIDRTEDRIVARVEEMNLLLCREQDILIVRERPDEAYLAKLREWGFEVPRRILVPFGADAPLPISELVLQDEELKRELAAAAAEAAAEVKAKMKSAGGSGRTESAPAGGRAGASAVGTIKAGGGGPEDAGLHPVGVYFVPYAVTRLEERIAEECRLTLVGAPAAVSAAVNDKIGSRRIAQSLGLPVSQGRVCLSAAEIRDEYERLTERERFATVIVKEPHGASGKGLYKVDSPEKLGLLLSRLARFSRGREDAQWLVEGWYRAQADISLQLYVSPQGEARVFSIKRQVLRDTVYIGSRVPAELDESALSAYRKYGELIGRHLYEEYGYTGVAGIDSIITEEGTILPVIEINGRFTLSTYLSFVGDVLGEVKLYARYFKLLTRSPHDYARLCAAMEHEGLLYDRERGEGVLVYTSGTLSLPVAEGDGPATAYAGRLFTLTAARDWSGVDALSARLEAFVNRLCSSSSPLQQEARETPEPETSDLELNN
ncbi:MULTISPECIES: peptide ligase PGM1-related protein [unclassified Paenibacillus]|uniref:peptide ligase PGM1-related protein n=1 Tax=unclassified Paenibacillus TaxID=185978 RepID=UPI0009317871|nr:MULTISPECIES: peptide ligase PGM1-related protein [unclassified Paenibacillus]